MLLISTDRITTRSIGAQLGATINEFSIDYTLAGNSDNAVPQKKQLKHMLIPN